MLVDWVYEMMTYLEGLDFVRLLILKLVMLVYGLYLPNQEKE